MVLTSVKLAAGVFASCALLGQASAATDGTISTRSDVPDGFYVPAYYPAPYGGWIDEWAESYERAKTLVDSMTLAEKANITAGTGIYMGRNMSSILHISAANTSRVR